MHPKLRNYQETRRLPLLSKLRLIYCPSEKDWDRAVPLRIGAKLDFDMEDVKAWKNGTGHLQQKQIAPLKRKIRAAKESLTDISRPLVDDALELVGTLLGLSQVEAFDVLAGSIIAEKASRKPSRKKKKTATSWRTDHPRLLLVNKLGQLEAHSVSPGMQASVIYDLETCRAIGFESVVDLDWSDSE